LRIAALEARLAEKPAKSKEPKEPKDPKIAKARAAGDEGGASEPAVD